MAKLSPNDFKLTLMEEASRLRHFSIAQSSTHYLDERTLMLVIRMEAWREFMRSADLLNAVQFSQGGQKRNELMGLPVRLTIDDSPDTPMIQLVMEPKMIAR